MRARTLFLIVHIHRLPGHRFSLPRVLRTRQSVKNVSGHFVKDVMGLNKVRKDGAPICPGEE
jgi:hypothetical protein